MHRVGTERNDNFYFHSFSNFTNQKASNEDIMVSFNFLYFFAIFFEFSITRRVEMERNDNFYFLSLSQPFCNVFWLEMKPQRYFLIFLIFLEFSITHRVGTKWNDNFYFLSFSAFSSIFSLKMKPQWYWFIFLTLFVIFYHASSKNGTEG